MDENKDEIINALKKTLINYEKTMIKVIQNNKKEIDYYKYKCFNTTNKAISNIEYDFICNLSNFEENSKWEIEYSKSFAQAYRHKVIYSEEKMQNIVIGLIGRISSGKTNILNRIINQNNRISHSSDINVKYNEDKSVVIIDTKGIDSFDSNEQNEKFIINYISKVSHIVIYVTSSITRSDKAVIEDLSHNKNIKLFVIHNLYMCYSISDINEYANNNLRKAFEVDEMNFDKSSNNDIVHYYSSDDSNVEHFVIGNENSNEEEIIILNKKVFEYIKGYINSVKNVIAFDPIDTLQTLYEEYYSNGSSTLKLDFDNKYIQIINK